MSLPQCSKCRKIIWTYHFRLATCSGCIPPLPYNSWCLLHPHPSSPTPIPRPLQVQDKWWWKLDGRREGWIDGWITFSTDQTFISNCLLILCSAIIFPLCEVHHNTLNLIYGLWLLAPTRMCQDVTANQQRWRWQFVQAAPASAAVMLLATANITAHYKWVVKAGETGRAKREREREEKEEELKCDAVSVEIVWRSGTS